MQCSAGLHVRHVASALRVARAAHTRTPQPYQCRYASQQSRRPKQPAPTAASTPAPFILEPETAENALKQKPRKLPWVLASLMGGIIAFYGANLYVAANQPCQNPDIALLSQQKDVVARYDDTADSFDSEVGFSEWLMGVNKNRKQLAQRCHGHVLEVSCGTGRNLGYYDIKSGGSVESLTFVDISPQMVDVCKKKWMALFERARGGSRIKPGLLARFLPASALGQMPLAPTDPPKKYDTIIQTMGLCSTPSPVELLENMVQHLDTSNPESRIILLEHGRSYQAWLNRILDNSAEKHAEIHGCWFNRDIGALVADAAAKAGLVVVNERRRHFGTTWMFELKPNPSPKGSGNTASQENTKPEEEKPSKTWIGFHK